MHHIKAPDCEWNFYQSPAITFVLLETTASKPLTIAFRIQWLKRGWKFDRPWGLEREQGKGSAHLQSKGNLLASGLSDKLSCSHKWPHGFDCFDGCVRFHLASPSRWRNQWLLCSHEGQSNALISRLIHIPSELEKMEARMWGIIINTRAVSPSHESGRTLHNDMAGSRDEAWAAERRPGRPWPRH